MVSHVRVGYNRNHLFERAITHGEDWSGKLGIPNLAKVNCPTFTFSEYPRFGVEKDTSPPGARALTRLIPAVAAFGNQTFRTLRAHRSSEIRKVGFKLWRMAYRLAQRGQDTPL